MPEPSPTMGASLPENETERLAELRGYRILDTLAEQAYDDITYLASLICDCPIALVSLVDKDRQWFKSKVGLEVSETSRDLAFCAHAILDPSDLLVVPDARLDRRFAANPLVVDEPSIRFYAGAPLVTSTGNALGTLCVIDQEPRELEEDQERALQALSRLVMNQLELRRTVAELNRHSEKQRQYEKQLMEYQRELERSNELLEDQSSTDALTGLHNRRAFVARIEEEAERALRHDLPLSLLLLDVDSFKSYNDTFGHPAGDQVLKKLAQLLQHHQRRTDFVARYGGEEFAIILVNTDEAGALVLAERFRRAIEHADWFDRPITASFGVATGVGGEVPDTDLIKDADRALYQAKEQGRNRTAQASALQTGLVAEPLEARDSSGH